MKKHIKFISLLLCVMFLFASAQTAFAFFDPFQKLSDDKDVKITLKGSVVKEPPYYLYLEHKQENIGTVPSLLGNDKANLTWKLEGKRNSIENQVEGEWEFTIFMDFVSVNTWHEINDHIIETVLVPGREHVTVNAKAKGIVTDSSGKVPEIPDPMEQARQKRAQKQEKKQKDIAKVRELLEMDPVKRKAKIEEDKAKALNPQAKTVYKAFITIPGTQVLMRDSTPGLLMSVSIPSGDINHYEMTTLKYWRARELLGDVNFYFDLTIDDKDNAKADLVYTDQFGSYTHELTGQLTCQKSIETKLKISKKFPIWGTWTDKDPYAAVPKILADHQKRQTQLAAKKTDPSAKVDTIVYNNGKWLTLVKGKTLVQKSPFDPKNEPYVYQMIEITDEFIQFEIGEIWLGVSLGMHPTEKYYFPRDHQNNTALFSEPLSAYSQPLSESFLNLSYNSITDTIRPTLGFFMGTTLYRVKGPAFYDTWSNVKGVEKPDPKSVRSTAGTWYDFAIQKGVYTDGKDKDGNPAKVYEPPEVGGANFEKVTVHKNGTAEVLSGSAEINALSDYIVCYVEKRVTYDANGKATTENYGNDNAKGDEDDDDEFDYEELIIAYSDYNKAAGTIKFDGETFYKVSKATLNGTWSTQEAAPPLPDASNKDAREAIARNYKVPVLWYKFNSPGMDFTRLTWRPGEGLLIETGAYRNLGDGRIVLDNIVGTFYGSDGELAFEKTPRDGSETLGFCEETSNTMYLNNSVKMYKTPK